MLVIHGIWARDALCLWAEDSALPASLDAPAGGAGRPGPPGRTRSRPIPASSATRSACSARVPGTWPARRPRTNCPLWLPSAGPGPRLFPAADPGRPPMGL